MAHERSYWELIEPYWGQLGTYSDAAEYLATAKRFPEPIVLLYAAHFCQSEVHNGGLLQFFRNSTGVLAPEAVAGFRAAGMLLLAEVVEVAMSRLGAPYPREREDRWDALLRASKLPKEKLKSIFSKAQSLWLGYREATTSLGFDALDEQFWHLAATENGGFEAAATEYALSVENTLAWPIPSPNPAQSE